jgi:hypothetical protein
MDSEKFKNIATGLQSVITCVAIIVGGVWAYYTFRVLGSSTKAQAEIQLLQQQALEQPNLSISISSSYIHEKSKAKYTALIIVELKNEGKRAVEYRDAGIELKLVSPQVNATNGYTNKLNAVIIDEEGTYQTMPDRILRTGQARRLVFPATSLEPDLYLIQFSITYLGMRLEDGQFKESNDANIQAFEQSFVDISSRPFEQSTSGNR